MLNKGAVFFTNNDPLVGLFDQSNTASLDPFATLFAHLFKLGSSSFVGRAKAPFRLAI